MIVYLFDVYYIYSDYTSYTTITCSSLHTRFKHSSPIPWEMDRNNTIHNKYTTSYKIYIEFVVLELYRSMLCKFITRQPSILTVKPRQKQVLLHRKIMTLPDNNHKIFKMNIIHIYICMCLLIK